MYYIDRFCHKLFTPFIPLLFLAAVSTNIAQSQWTLVSSGTTNNLEGIAMAGAQTLTNTGTIIIFGDKIALRSTDHGRTWAKVYQGSTHFYDVQFSNNGKGIAVGEGGYRYLSTDDGLTWHSSGYSGSTVYYAAACANTYFVNEYGTGFAVGSWPFPDITRDDGITWNASNSGLLTGKNYFGADFDGFTMVIVGGSGQIWTSTDNGSSWSDKTNNIHDGQGGFTRVFNQLRCVSSITQRSQQKDVCGNDGVVLISQDEGETWYNQSPSGVTTNFNSIIDDVTRNKLVVVGASGTILSTTDLGSTWDTESSNTSENLTDILDIGNGELLAIGEGGTILLYTQISSVEDEKLLLSKYELSQNYPNPFNPSTSISFTIGERGFVKLKIVNELGESVRELVNEVKEAGSYTAGFDAANLSSGIYFYTLQINGFTDTKKMLLIK